MVRCATTGFHPAFEKLAWGVSAGLAQLLGEECDYKVSWPRKRRFFLGEDNIA